MGGANVIIGEGCLARWSGIDGVGNPESPPLFSCCFAVVKVAGAICVGVINGEGCPPPCSCVTTGGGPPIVDDVTNGEGGTLTGCCIEEAGIPVDRTGGEGVGSWLADRDTDGNLGSLPENKYYFIHKRLKKIEFKLKHERFTN